MTALYKAIWPITDISLPFLTLIEQGKAELPDLTRFARVRIAGPGRWSVAESRHVPGSGGITPWVLIYEAPAEHWRPADDPVPKADRRIYRCACGARTNNTTRTCLRCEEAKAAA